LRRLTSIPLIGVIVAAAALVAPTISASAAFANDNFASATVISTLPFSDSGDLSGTTTEPGEPQFCNFMQQTVWYSYTAASATALKLDLNGSDFGVVLNAYRQLGSGFSGLSFQGCLGFGGSMELFANPGQTIYLQAGSVGTGSAHLQLHVQSIPPPPNDNFVNATTVAALPFNDNPDMTAATVEPGEPTVPAGAFTPIVASAWYKFTPAVSESLSASANSCCATPILAAYTGSTVSSLTQVGNGVSGFGQMLTFRAAAGTTYYFQLGRGSLFGGSAPMSFSLQLTPPPVATFFFFPSDPSIFDTVQFSNASFDPGGLGISSQAWNFGDGTSATVCCPTHRYAVDGTYTVKLTVATPDGRTASTSQALAVKTHDVAITKFAVPNAASAGQTRDVVVGISNSRYPETVQVQLFKSVPGPFNNFVLVGTLTNQVPVLSGNKKASFDFSYTFTRDDAAVGKVTFEAIATIVGARDALPADNTAISLPTKVN
jgi:PKD repeat protein